MKSESRASDLGLLFEALGIAAELHAGQTRRDRVTPYLNHPIDVARILVEIGDVGDVEVLAAALLHDTVEDTDTSIDELEARFGARIAGLVEEMTDDMGLPRAERKRRQVAHVADLSPAAKLLKLADKISNVGDLIRSPPAAWSWQKRRDYLDWTEEVIAGCRGVHAGLEAAYDEALAAGRRALAEEKAGP